MRWETRIVTFWGASTLLLFNIVFIIIVIALIVARSVYLMKKRKTGFSDWLLKEDENENRKLSRLLRFAPSDDRGV